MRWFRRRGGIRWPWLLLLPSIATAVILSGGPDSYARYPKWAHSYENSLSLELKTRQANGLLLYTDDGGVAGNFYAISISDGRIQLDFRLGDKGSDFGQRRPVTTIRIEEVRVDDDRWHTLRVHQSFENVKLELDYTLVFKILNQRSFVFGNIQKNSHVFIGGLPKDVHQLPVLSSPLRRHSRHLAVNVRNLVYRLYPQGETSPQLLDGHGIRHNEDDYCRSSGFSSREIFTCQHGGRCYSMADGPGCDCSMSDHEGKHCEIEKTDAELTFSGHEWLGYDVSSNVSSMMKARRENLTLSFKTVHGTAMLFYSGDDKSYLHLMLDDGALIATSKFEGTDPRLIRMFNSYPGERYDDDSWHSIVLERTLQMMTLTVDGRRDEIRQYAPELDWISNNHAFLGGIPHGRAAHGVQRDPFRGCMKLVQYEADAIQLQFVNLADQGYGQSVIRSGGELSYSCKHPFQHADVVSFEIGSSVLTLPLQSPDPKGGSLSFSFRAAEPDGLLFYHGSLTDNSSEFIAFELLDGHLFMVIDLGAGAVRLQTTSKRVTYDSEWHNVYMERLRRSGSVVVDQQKTDFSTPGISANLDVADPAFLGGIPPASIVFPSSIWSINLRKGFVGCLKNVRFNGMSTKIAQVLENSNATGVSLGCPAVSAPGKCSPNPCQNYGICSEGLLSFSCDCSATNKEGSTCSIEPTVVDIDGEKASLSVLPKAVLSEAEDISVRFRTNSSRGTILETRSVHRPRHRMGLAIDGKELRLLIETEHTNHSFSWGYGASDGRWHTANVKRRGSHLLLNWDGKWGKSYFLPTSVVVEMDEMTGGRSLRSDDSQDPPFRGQMTKLVLNNVDILEKSKKEGRSSKEHKGQRNIKSKISAVSFTNTTGFVVFSPSKISAFTGAFRVSFKFQTLVRTAVLFSTIPGESPDTVLLQLVNGRVRFSHHNEIEDIQMTSPRLPGSQQLSDMRWHAILVYQDPKTRDFLMLVDNTSVVASSETKKELKLAGPVALGGIPRSLPGRGFRGCIASLRLNDKPLDILEDADERSDVIRGCSGPIARCSPAACSNGGRCVQQWHAIRCDCSLTAHAGDRCQDAATAVTFNGDPSAVYFEYPAGEMPSTTQDYLVLAFKTTQSKGVLFSVECAADEDFLTIYLDGGYVQMRYNLGSRDHHVGYFSQPVNDGKTHTLKILRHHVKSTVQLDRGPAIRYSPKGAGEELVTLNMHWRLVLGASFNTKHTQTRIRKRNAVRLNDPFQGEISGVNFNGVHVLQLFAEGSPRVSSVGPVKTSVVSPVSAVHTGEDVMLNDDTHESASDALIESLGASCLSEEERQTCFVDTDESGFFTPVLPSSAPQTRRVTPSGANGEWLSARASTTGPAAPPVVFLSELDELLEGSGLPPETQLTPATKPLSTSTSPPTTTTTTTTAKTTAKIQSTTTKKVTVLPRPYESVSLAAELNPEYLGESIWAEVDILPEPMVTGPAWRTQNLTTSYVKAATKAMTTTTVKQTTSTAKKASTTRRPPTTTMRTMRTTSKWMKTTERSTPAITFTSTLLSTSTKLSAKLKTTPSFSVYPVRPTTPMGDLATTTVKYVAAADPEEFPKTALVMIASLTVVLFIAVIVFCVFWRCRQSGAPGEHYPMSVNGKPSGYAPISAELSPPLGMDPSTQPLLPRQPPQVNGYQPLKGAVVPNGNGVMRNGNGIVKNGVAKKKDFKEWYV